jgi:hypothetical protein
MAIGKDVSEAVARAKAQALSQITAEQLFTPNLDQGGFLVEEPVGPDDFEIIRNETEWWNYTRRCALGITGTVIHNGTPTSYPCMATSYADDGERSGAAFFHKFLYPVDAADLLDVAKEMGVKIT